MYSKIIFNVKKIILNRKINIFLFKKWINKAKKAAEKRAKFQEQKPQTAQAVTFQPDGSKVFQQRSTLVSTITTQQQQKQKPSSTEQQQQHNNNTHSSIKSNSTSVTTTTNFNNGGE